MKGSNNQHTHTSYHAIQANGKKPFFVTCDLARKLKTLHWFIWVNMLRGYYSCLDPSVNNINA
jgi:hypothetical protein